MKVNSNFLKRALAGAAKRLGSLRGEEGTELVEFAFIAPWFMALLMGTVSFGMAFYSMQQLSNATALAVQAATYAESGKCTATGPGCSASEVSGGDLVDLCAAAQATVQSKLANWNAGNFKYSMTITNPVSGTSNTYSDGYGGTFSCNTGSSSTTDAQDVSGQVEAVQLTVTYKYQWVPMLLISPSTPLSATQSAIAE
ncbi:MAG: TadE/TadG family type IV pilus assembly protein [Terracidiphilus sp.]|jgi:Flp pilus assembly protein TadG